MTTSNHIIASFINKKNDQVEMRNPSGWIYSSVLTARKNVEAIGMATMQRSDVIEEATQFR